MLGILGMMHETKENTLAGYQTMYLTVAAIGIGSMLFHGTLTVWGQQLDELPMVWHLLMSMYIINRGPLETTKNGKLFLSIGLCLYGLIFSIAHVIFRTTTAFQVHFGTLLGVLLVRVYHRFRNVELTADATKILSLFLSSGTIGFGMWLLDYHHCDFLQSSFFGFNPQLHSFWHLFMVLLSSSSSSLSSSSHHYQKGVLCLHVCCITQNIGQCTREPEYLYQIHVWDTICLQNKI